MEALDNIPVPIKPYALTKRLIEYSAMLTQGNQDMMTINISMVTAYASVATVGVVHLRISPNMVLNQLVLIHGPSVPIDATNLGNRRRPTIIIPSLLIY
jgi:hypothetical protein